MFKKSLPQKTSEKRNFFFVINPQSGSSKDFSSVRKLRDCLRARGDHVFLDLTQSLEHAGQLARQARETGYDVVIVAGGDGTVRAVAEAMAGSSLPIMVVPSGTENLMATELGLDGSFLRTLKTLDYGVSRRMDLGLANGQHFMAIAGVGFDAEVIHRIYKFRSGHITHTDYVWPICRTFWEYRFPQLHIEADGQLVCDEPALVFISNISRYAIGLGISPKADYGDGLLDLCIYKCRNRMELLKHSAATVAHQSHRSPRVYRGRHKHLRISSPKPNVHVQLDGDPGPDLPLEVGIEPGSACILAPPSRDQEDYFPPLRFYYLRRWLLR